MTPMRIVHLNRRRPSAFKYLDKIKSILFSEMLGDELVASVVFVVWWSGNYQAQDTRHQTPGTL